MSNKSKKKKIFSFCRFGFSINYLEFRIPDLGFLLLFFSLMGSYVFADFSKSDSGTSVAQFLKLGVSARADGMGGAYSALGGDWAGLAYNPALLVTVDHYSFGGLYANQTNNINYGHAAWVGSTKKMGSFGLNYTHLSFGSIQGYDEQGFKLFEFTPRDTAVGFGWAKAFPFAGGTLAPGIAGKWIRLKITNSATAFAGDVGFLYQRERFAMALAAQNVGSKIKFISEEEDLPVIVRLGLAYHLRSQWPVVLDIVSPKDEVSHLAVGTEYRHIFKERQYLTGRIGVNTQSIQGSLSGIQGVRVGFGVGGPTFGLDYTFLPMGVLGFAHRVSLNVRWSDKPKKKETFKRRRRVIGR